jgi:two-component system sensor histidine kinase YesM
MKFRNNFGAYANAPIRFKLIIWWLPVVLFTVTAMGGYTYVIASGAITKRTQLVQQQLTKEAIYHLDNINQDIVNNSSHLFLSDQVQNYLLTYSSDKKPNKYKTFLAHHEILKYVVGNSYSNFWMVLRPGVESVAVDLTNSGLSNKPPTYDDLVMTSLYLHTNQQEDQSYWTMTNMNGYHLPAQTESNCIVYIRIFRNQGSVNDSGVVVMGIDEVKLRDRFKKLVEPDTELLILNKEGFILSDTDGEWGGKSFQELPYFKNMKLSDLNEIDKQKSKKWLFSSSQSLLSGWQVVLIQPRHSLLQEVNTIGILTITMMSICFLMSILFSWKVTSIIFNPIKALLNSMKQFQMGDFDQQVSIKNKDEIGSLGLGYNKMVIQIKKLIDDVYLSSLRTREAEIRTLQAQINPHFLYNTLNTISWSARQRGESEIADMVYSLSQLFRLSLNEGEDWLAIEKELELVDNYLRLQQMRFGNRLAYEIKVADEAKPIRIPKLLIQPFVENAVIHGIEPLVDQGFVSIEVFIADKLNIVITDNGRGMSAQQLKELTSHQPSSISNKHPSEKRVGYAIQNCMERLKLHYDAEAEIQIQSVINLGTTVVIQIPVN